MLIKIAKSQQNLTDRPTVLRVPLRISSFLCAYWCCTLIVS